MRIPFVTSSLREHRARPITTALFFALFVNALTSAAHVSAGFHIKLEEVSLWMGSRTRRGALNLRPDALCKRTRRDVAAVKTILSRNSRPFSHEIWISNGINLSGPEHVRATEGNPELAVDAMIGFLRDFENFLRVYSRRYRQSVSPRDLRPLLLKLRRLHSELPDLLALQRPNYSRSRQRVENLQRNRPALNMADHVTSLLSNLDRSVVKLCDGVTPTSIQDHYALKVR